MNLEIASRLVALRKENKLSQEALAEKLGISRQAVSKWERAEASPDTDNLIALAKLYHISLDDLLKIHEDTETGPEPTDAVSAAMGSEMNSGCLAEESMEQYSADNQSGASYVQPVNGTYLQEGDREKDGTHGQTAGRDDEGMYGQKADQGKEGSSDSNGAQDSSDNEEDVHIGFDGIHVKDKDGEVHVSWSGIHVQDKRNENEVHIDKNGIRVIGDDAQSHVFTRGKEAEFPLFMTVIVVYIVIGVLFDLWHPGWLVFFLAPIISSFICAVRNHNANLFAYPVLAALVFLYSGLVHYVWHPVWAVFLTIPLYYSIVGYVRGRRRQKEENEFTAHE